MAETLDLTKASIANLKQALDSGAITCVELVSLYLHRIGKYDCRGPSLNSVCVLNPNVFGEAQASDDYRVFGRPSRPLEGIPFTVKDSFKVKNMAVAAGSPAFTDLIATEDAAIVKSLRDAGAVLIGRTNMPPMADGGSQRGAYGRAESPYNLVYSPTAFASGSSNGSGTAITASFAAFGLAGETVSSGRAPASNSSLIGYSPSWGVIPNRGQWPLYPTCDVIVPHTRSLQDMFDVLNVTVVDDPRAATGVDFWRNQPYVRIPEASNIRPLDYHSLEDRNALKGKRIAIPLCFLGAKGAKPETVCSEPVLKLFNCAREHLEALGAVLIETDFPVFEQYCQADFVGQSANVPGMSKGWVSIERCEMIATSWDEFLKENGDAKIPSLQFADPQKIRPNVSPMDNPTQFTEAQNQVRYVDMIDSVREHPMTLNTLPGCEQSLKALDMMRRDMFERWMDDNHFDLVCFPSNGDIGRADADEYLESMVDALRDGVKYSNGGRALKHLGIPCITVPMGKMEDKQMPVGLTFCSKAWKDSDLLASAFAFEASSCKRVEPPLAPALASDRIEVSEVAIGTESPDVTVTKLVITKDNDAENEVRNVTIAGVAGGTLIDSVQAFGNGEPLKVEFSNGEWHLQEQLTRPKRFEKFPTPMNVPKDQFMVVVVVKAGNGRCVAKLLMID